MLEQVDFSQLVELMSRGDMVDVRCAFSRDEMGAMLLQSLIAVTHQENRVSEPEIRDYGSCVFTQVVVSNMELSNALGTLRTTGIIPSTISGLPDATAHCDFDIESAHFNHYRVYSRSSYGAHPMFSSPSDLYQINVSRNRDFDWNSGPANQSGLPYFRTFAQAAYHYLYRTQIPLNVGEPAVFEIQMLDDRGRLDSVIVGENSLRVFVSGNKVSRCELKLLGLDPTIVEVLSVNDVLTHDIPLQIRPQDLTVALTLDGEILDIRDPIRRFAPRAEKDTIKEEPIENFIAWHGESLTIEYKTEWSKEVAKSIVGFANAEGGSVFFGIRDDVEGIQIQGVDNIDELKNSIHNIIEKTSGYFAHRIEVHEIQGKSVMRLIVEEAPEKPVAMIESGEHRFYIRRDGSTRRVRREDILNWCSPAPQYGEAVHLRTFNQLMMR